MGIWDRLAPRYDSFVRRFVSEQYSEIVGRVWDIVGAGQNVLEIGAGTGNVSLEVARKAGSVTISDISPRMIEIATAKASRMGRENVSFVVSDASSLPFAKEQFDVCLIINVLHILENPLSCLKESRRVLKPQGLLIVSTFSHGEQFKTRIMSTILSLVTRIVFRKMSVTDVADMAEEAGFYVIEKQHIDGEIAPFSFLVAKPYQKSAP